MKKTAIAMMFMLSTSAWADSQSITQTSVTSDGAGYVGLQGKRVSFQYAPRDNTATIMFLNNLLGAVMSLFQTGASMLSTIGQQDNATSTQTQ
jgi:hypothetical protein